MADFAYDPVPAFDETKLAGGTHPSLGSMSDPMPVMTEAAATGRVTA